MIKFSISAAGEQTLKKICNHCKCEIQDLNMDDILVKADTDLIIKDSQGNEVTRTEIPDELVNCKWENCND